MKRTWGRLIVAPLPTAHHRRWQVIQKECLALDETKCGAMFQQESWREDIFHMRIYTDLVHFSLSETVRRWLQASSPWRDGYARWCWWQRGRCANDMCVVVSSPSPLQSASRCQGITDAWVQSGRDAGTVTMQAILLYMVSLWGYSPVKLHRHIEKNRPGLNIF